MKESVTPISMQNLEQLEEEVNRAFPEISNEKNAEEFRVLYLGKKGKLKLLYQGLGSLPLEERKRFGERINALMRTTEERFAEAPWKNNLPKLAGGPFDPSLPPWPIAQGSIHPVTRIRNEICDIFVRMGFSIAYGPDVETDYYNFEALNFPKHHPARDMQDTFFVDGDLVLRTHTSPVQIRVMEKHKPPLRYIMPGVVYRHEEISARSYCQFSQVEGLWIDEKVSLADLKGTLLAFARQFFNEDAKIKVRPSFFPFTEPSIEIDVECYVCSGTGCSVCKQSGWLEILGAGMVHPNVLRNAGVDAEKYTGFAFGIGIERTTMLRFGISDIRLLFENDIRFLNQF